MDITTSAQVLLDGSLESDHPESLPSQLARFSKISGDEHGLVSISQGGYILGRSKQLVHRLVAQRRLTTFKFFGRTYLSVKELKEFHKMERLPGRPLGKRLIAATKLATATLIDPLQQAHDITDDFQSSSMPVIE